MGIIKDRANILQSKYNISYKQAEYLACRLIAKQTKEHIIKRLNEKIICLENDIDHKITISIPYRSKLVNKYPAKKDIFETKIKELLQHVELEQKCIEKYKSYIEFLENTKEVIL